MTKAVFFDRDGVLNVDTGYVGAIESLEIMDGAAAALAMIKDAGYKIIVVTNQSGVARGMFTCDDVEAVNGEINRRVGLAIDHFYYCPYHPDGSIEAYAIEHEDRKPGPGMINRAVDDHDIDREGSFLIGDNDRDIEAANRAGMPGFLFDGTIGLDAFVKTLLDGTLKEEK